MFSGSYVEDFKRVTEAALLAELNALFISPSGWGKTAIMSNLADHYAPSFFIELDPSTPPDAVRGPYNPAAFLNGKMERITQNTPFDPAVNVAFLDEVGRAGESMFDALLSVLGGRDTRCTVIASTNFMPTGTRQAAFVDRFALWAWVIPQSLNIEEVALANMRGKFPKLDMKGMPNTTEIEEIRKADVGPNAEKAVLRLLNDLDIALQQNGRSVNPRRISQWSRLLTRHSMWVTGKTDFHEVPQETARLLRFAYPMVDDKEWASWGEISASVIDVVGSAIEAVLAEAYNTMKSITYNATDIAGAQKFFSIVASANANLAQISSPDDERVQKATAQIGEWFAQISQGKKLV